MIPISRLVRWLALSFALLILTLLQNVLIATTLAALIIVGGFWLQFRQANRNLYKAPALVKHRLNYAWTAIVRYLPLILVLLLGTYLHLLLAYNIKAAMYLEEIVLRDPAASGDIGLIHDTRSFEEDVLKTISKRAGEATESAVKAINSGADHASENVNARKDDIANAFQSAMMRDVIPRQRCNFFVRWLCDAVNNTYRDGIGRQTQQIRATSYSAAATLTEADAKFRREIEAQAAEAIGQASTTIQNMMRWSFRLSDVLQAFAVLFLILAIIKSLGYLYARIALSETRLSQDFCPRVMRARQGRFRLSRKTNHLSLSVGDKHRIYLTSNLNFIGDVETKKIPIPGSLPIKRLLRGKYVLHEVVGRTPQVNVLVETRAGDQFVEVAIQKNTEIFFDMQNLAGFSSGITFKSYANFRLLGLIFGRFTYHCAVGPGVLLLIVPGGCSVPAANAEFSLNRLVAWTGRAKFSVNSSLRLADLYFSAISIVPSINNACIIQAATNIKRRNYMSRFFRRFFWPL